MRKSIIITMLLLLGMIGLFFPFILDFLGMDGREVILCGPVNLISGLVGVAAFLIAFFIVDNF